MDDRMAAFTQSSSHLEPRTAPPASCAECPLLSAASVAPLPGFTRPCSALPSRISDEQSSARLSDVRTLRINTCLFPTLPFVCGYVFTMDSPRGPCCAEGLFL
uniref:Uncharacterized protein n=1 Tax=Knipowitschia caucasica TaxID=637954 RepID=A0AAV2MH96_KNICA